MSFRFNPPPIRRCKVNEGADTGQHIVGITGKRLRGVWVRDERGNGSTGREGGGAPVGRRRNLPPGERHSGKKKNDGKLLLEQMVPRQTEPGLA